LYQPVVALQDLSVQILMCFDLVGEDFAVPSYVIEFDFDHFFLVVAAID
jgi:hypothetical protein